MNSHRRSAFVIVVLVSSVACGSKPEPAASSDMKQGAKTVAEGAKDMASGLEALGKGLEEMANSAEMKPVEPVNFRDLQAVFPDLAGWQKGKPTGERMTSPVSFSQAQVKYTKDDATIEAKIVDSGFNQIMMAPFAMFLAAGYDKETEDGYEKSVKVGDYPGWEKWNSEGKDGELNAIVNKRFLVTLEGSGLTDTAVLHELAQKADLGKLASIK